MEKQNKWIYLIEASFFLNEYKINIDIQKIIKTKYKN